MRLVIDGRRLSSERTGVGRYLESLLLEWAALSAPLSETLVVLQDPSGRVRIPPCPGLATVVIGERWPGLVWERFGLGRVLRPDDLLFAPANLVPGNWRGTAVLVIHDLIQEVLPGSFPWHVRLRFARRYRLAAKKAQTILVPSAATARDVERIYGIEPARIRVVPPAHDPELRPLRPDDPLVRSARHTLGLGDDPFFLFVGKRTRRRNVSAIMRAFELIRRAHPVHRLVFIGPNTQKMARNVGEAGNNIHLVGHVSESILRGLYAGATALLYPSEYEGFGLPVVEAMASGCPVVTLRNSALIESAGDAAWFLESVDPAHLADAMRTLATDADRRADHVARGLAHAAKFSRASFAERVKAELVAAAGLSARPTKAETHARAGVASGSR